MAALPWLAYFCIRINMATQSKTVYKKVGRPAGVRFSEAIPARFEPHTMKAIDAWADGNGISRSEAIRRLVEIGLAKAPKPRRARPGHKNSTKASEMAGKQIDRLGDPSATEEQRQKRKHRLTKGPTEFREARRDQSAKQRRARSIKVTKLNASNDV
jgi:hypothetical protein